MVDFFLALLRFPLFFLSFSSVVKITLQTDFAVWCFNETLYSGKSKGKQMATQPRHSQPCFLPRPQASAATERRALPMLNFSAEGEKLYHGTRLTKKKSGDLSEEQLPVVTSSFTLLHNIRRPISPRG